ncbi:receptor-type tyrosine-protein phosphatase T isoform X2 [Procambarus clarkii]|uniref:receptor-type tyrosine-protein phosphatase T isoform X2 n=1 Tax=Procambarus clarkii TaxID=6728 RepID=UPI0037421E03
MTLPSRFLIIMVVVGVVTAARYSRASERCKTFHKHRSSTQYWCNSNCVTGAGEDRKVFGTGVYHESSDICLAALHIGAISSAGGSVTIKQETNVPERVNGTTRNRIVSSSTNVNSSSAVYKIIKTSPAVTQEDLRGDVVMVHNSYSDSQKSGRQLSLSCLSQDMTTKLTKKSLVSWAYKSSDPILEAITSENEHQLILSAEGGQKHAFRCLGRSPATDVAAAVQFYDATYHSPSPTVRFSKGEDVIIPLVKKGQSLPSGVKTQKLPDGWSDTTLQIPLSYGPADLSLAGIYVAGDNTAAYFDVIIRECEKQKYGIECENDCPKCQHGGQCHTQTGTCVCPPGFIGDTCQHACLPGTFGEKCQLRCDLATLGFATTREGDCHGLVICLPEPYGCSCAPGYTYLETYDGSTNPICTKECPHGTFGVNCSETCSKCRSNMCDRFTGTCSSGCRNNNCGGAPVLSEVFASGLRRQLNINWKSVEGELYFVTYQFVKYQSCGRTEDAAMKQWQQVLQESSPAEIKDLMPYSKYNVCVVASNSDGHSPRQCGVASTLAEVPDVNVMGLKCSSYYYNKMKCDFQISGNCENYNGPNLTYIVTIQTNLTCNKSVHELSQNGLVSADGRVTVKFPDAIAGQNYKVTAQVKNDAGNGNVTSIDFTTRSSKPPPVQNLTASVIDSKTVQLLWNDPCPSYGLLSDFYSYHDRGYYLLVKCPTSAVYDHCHTITGLVSGQEYEFGVALRNAAKEFGQYASTKVKVMEKEPGPPEPITSGRGARQLNLTINFPSDPGGILQNCSLSLSGTSQASCFRPINQGTPLSPCTFGKLEPGKRYQAETYCCNSMFCGKKLRQEVGTLPMEPEFSGDLTILKKTNTTITLGLPSLITSGDGNKSVFVVVQKADYSTTNITEDILKLLPMNRWQDDQNGHDTRHIHTRQTNPNQQCQQSLWIAGLVNEDEMKFEIGDGRTYNNYFNCPLEYQHEYYIGIMATVELLGVSSYKWLKLLEVVVVKPWEPETIALWWLLLVVLLILVIIAVIYFRYHKSAGKPWSFVTFNKGSSNQALHDKKDFVVENHSSLASAEQITAKTAIPTPYADPILVSNKAQVKTPAILPQSQVKTPAPLPQINGEVVTSDPTYENFSTEDIYENVTRRIPYAEVEAYLNRIIKAYETSEEFRSVPDNFNKSSDVGQLPENKPKNRFRNNLPYDDTRVLLSIINDDPYSDYINANHVSGYGGMRYIAAQGPKDVKVPTIVDFWRMIIEHDINAIIMVANFVEGGKSKVGEYLNPGATLDFDGYLVSVLHREQFPHFNVSSVQVSTGGLSHSVQHYHYTSWPDHGIPDEAGSMAQMLRHYQNRHSEGGTIVHCSAGIGRTGTVLQVLLMFEMLAVEGSFDPLEVLKHLRNCRARLVENQAQYNLSLQILDEILFGEKTIVSAEHLQNSLDSYLSNCKAQLRNIKALPSPLSYKSTSNPSFESMNRNNTILPADSQRIYLQMENGEPESQYINAVKVAGLMHTETLLVTEHPMPITLPKFWRMVVEKGSSLVILINQFDEQSKDEFPDLMPYVGGMWTLGEYTIHAHQAQPYGNSLMQYTVQIQNSKNLLHNVQVYQVLSWQYGQDVPPVPDVLLKLAELLLQNPSSTRIGPPILCCGDGVTGCGLVAAMTLVVERLQNEQRVDVYRTVVKLLRSRPQFITSEAQFALLYSGAATYIENYSTYGNFF